jgi:ABC-type multidrug transport system fused ATPase/permease subunit
MYNKAISRYASAQRAEKSEINRVFDETVKGIDILRLFGAEKNSGEKFQSSTSYLRKLSVRAGSITAAFSPGVTLIAKFGGLCLIAAAYLMVSEGSIDSGPFLLFFFYTGLLTSSIFTLVNHVKNIGFELVGARSLAAFLSDPPKSDKPEPTFTFFNQPGPIEFSGVDFAYPGKKKIFRNVNLFIPAEAVTEITGPSGSGKSTIVNLLLRFCDPQCGVILIDGVNIKMIPRNVLRKKFSVVTQNHFIFNESLRDNLLIANPEACDSDMIRALKRAYLSQFVDGLSNGLDTILEPGGKKISAGEKQRISIARALLRNSPFIVLDEPWSNIDLEARLLLSRVINDLKSKATILILTHRNLRAIQCERSYRILPDLGEIVCASALSVPSKEMEVEKNEYMSNALELK